MTKEQLVNVEIQQCQYVILLCMYTLIYTLLTEKLHMYTVTVAIKRVRQLWMIQFLTFAKLMLTYGVSYEFYHELSSVVKELPQSHKVYKQLLATLGNVTYTM